MTAWTIADMPPQDGKTAIVTGADGLGFQAARGLAAAGAAVLLAGRNEAKGQNSVHKIVEEHPGARIRFEMLDLASLQSIKSFVDRVAQEQVSVDLLINNAGVMAPPVRQTTVDGFELQFGTNYLAHFALTGYLLPLLKRSGRARVINLGSLSHAMGKINFDDLQWQRTYSAMQAYNQSKLATLLFAFELQRRSATNGWNIVSLAAHPGFATTKLVANGQKGRGFSPMVILSDMLGPIIGQSPEAGALPILFAAASSEAAPGAYYGPDGFMEMKGAPTLAKVAPQAKDEVVAQRLWKLSQQLAGSPFPQ
jgi:NAD(P)-dependent dehydrogenase (short-subunit alcohol dehydrogenase family)